MDDRELKRRLEAFGRCVLETLHDEKEWSAATLDDIAALARQLGLADDDDEGYFRRRDTALTSTQRAIIKARTDYRSRP